MNTKIKFTYKDVPYVLEYDRDGIRALEANGLNIREFLNTPYTSTDLVFKCAFLKNHRKTSETIIDEIFKKMKDKDSLISQLINMITECYDSLFDEDENDEGNIKWDIEKAQ